MNSPSDQLISTADISNLSPDSSDAELELQGHTQLKDDRIALSNSDDYKDYSNKREAESETPVPTSIKKPRNARYAAAESLQKLAQAFTQSRHIRAPPVMTKLEEALNIMSAFVTTGKWKDEDYVEAYKIMLRDERHAIFFYSAPEHIQEGWIATMRASNYENALLGLLD